MFSKFPYSTKFLFSKSLQKPSLSLVGRRVAKTDACCCLQRLQPDEAGFPIFYGSRSFLFSSRLLTLIGNRDRTITTHNNNQKNDNYEQRRKTIPKLIYLHNPWKYLVTKWNLMRLYLFWDREFREKEFIRGAKQAAIVITNIIRNQNASRISYFTTPIGFQQITRDMILSRKDARLQLINFDTEHLRRAIPMKVLTRSKFGRSYCFIDMLFVVLRNSKDFDTTEEIVKVNEVIRRMDVEYKTPPDVAAAPHRIVFAEIFMRFRREYTELMPENADRDWSVSFYKILSFDVINYDPK